MNNSLKLCDISNISLRVHITFLFLPLIFGYLYGVRGIVFILGVFVCVILHELMHSLQARHYGIIVDQIVLLPIGGVASMRGLPKTPRQEFFIAIAGPLVNFVLAAVLALPAYALLRQTLFNPGLTTWPQTMAYIFWVNPWLGVFNLLPAFPMDGGRVLRSVLATCLPYLKATQIAVGIGHVFAFLFAFLGLFVWHSFMLVIVALFIYVAAAQEEQQVDLRVTLQDFEVRQIVSPEYVTVRPGSTLAEMIELVFHTHQEDFPVLESGKLVGMAAREDIIAHMRKGDMTIPAEMLMKLQFPAVNLHDSLVAVQQVMDDANVKAVPVLNHGRLAGIVSAEDISRAYNILSVKK